MSGIPHSIPTELVQAYRNASYVVSISNQEIILKVDQSNRELSALMKGSGVKSAAFLTAYNPFSQELTFEENQLRHGRLAAAVNSLGLEFFPGEGRDDSGLWPSERSILVLGIEFEDAEYLADEYGQNAFIWIETDQGDAKLHLRYPSGDEGWGA